jgi:hypothetical protein
MPVYHGRIVFPYTSINDIFSLLKGMMFHHYSSNKITLYRKRRVGGNRLMHNHKSASLYTKTRVTEKSIQGRKTNQTEQQLKIPNHIGG